MKKVLVIYYTQTGQLNSAVRSSLAPLSEQKDISITYEQIQPVTAYPYPWSYMEFFDIFPETIHGKATELKPFSFDPDEHFDLVVIAYQPWFLSICVPD